MRGVQTWRSGGVKLHPEDVDTPVVGCLCYGALSEWHLGEIDSCHALMDEAISTAKELKDRHALALALAWAASLGYAECNPAEVDRLASELIELSTRQNFLFWLALGAIFRGWARSASGNTAEGIPWIEQGITDYRATGSVLALPLYLAQKAEALDLVDRTSEALEAITKRKQLRKDLNSVVGAPDCTDFAVCFSRLWVLTRPKLRLRSAKPSESQRSRSRFR